MKNNKKIILILVLIMVVGVVGLTIAYFMSNQSVENIFKTKEFETTVYEEFVSPDNWLPCTETPKTITVTNTGEVDSAVRISLIEKWVNANNNEISGLIDSNGNLTDSIVNSEKAAIINFANNNDWEENNGYYYYKNKLEPGETTSTLINSVTFNCKTNASSTCTTSQDGKSIVCSSTGNGYDGATYALTFKIDTVQYENYDEAWNSVVDINNGNNNNQNNNSCSNESDDPITYKGEEYYILDSSNSEYTTLLKKNVLTASEVNSCSNSFVSQNGEYPYYRIDGCDGSEIGLCETNYDISQVKSIIDCWSNQFNDDLVLVEGYKARLLNKNEITSRLGIESSFEVTGGYKYESTECTPNWTIINEIPYWTNVSYQITEKLVLGQKNSFKDVYNNYYIRPVINVKKCALNGSC